MRKIFKPLISLGIIVAFVFFSVLCCCTATAFMAQFHKKVTCSHCHQKSSQSPVSPGSCQHQFLSADVTHASNNISTDVSVSSPHVLGFHHVSGPGRIVELTRMYPPGGPPLGISFTPLYLRTFNLRI